MLNMSPSHSQVAIEGAKTITTGSTKKVAVDKGDFANHLYVYVHAERSI